MRSLGSSGVWEIFIPDVTVGARYKYEVLGADSVWRDKADPLATHTEHPPATASVVYESSYDWSDAAWLDRRAQTALHAAPMSIYEVHLGSWRQGLSYRDLADQLVEYVTDMNSRTSNSCRWRSTPSAVPGVTRSRPITRRRADSATRTNCVT